MPTRTTESGHAPSSRPFTRSVRIRHVTNFLRRRSRECADRPHVRTLAQSRADFACLRGGHSLQDGTRIADDATAARQRARPIPSPLLPAYRHLRKCFSLPALCSCRGASSGRLAARTESHEARARHRSTGVTHHGYRSKDSLEPVMRPAPLFALSRQCSPAVGASPIRQRAARCSQRRGLPAILLLMRAEPGPARP